MNFYRAPSSMANPNVGDGFRSLEAALASTSTVQRQADKIAPVDLSEQAYRLRAVTSEQALRTELQLHLSASFKTLSTGGDAALDFYRRTEYSSFAIWFVATAELKFGGKKLNEFELTEQAKRDIERYGRNLFYERYGDSFVSEVRFGGQFSILFVVQCDTEEQYEALNASMAGKYGNFASTSELYQTIKSSIENVQIEFESFVVGFRGATPKLYIGMDPGERQESIDEMLDFVSKFPVLIQSEIDSGRPSVTYFTTRPMIEAQGWPLDLSSDTVDALTQLEIASDLRSRVSEVVGQLRYVVRNPGIFMPHDSRETSNGLEKLEGYCKSLDRAAYDISTAPWGVPLPPLPTIDLERLKILIPPRLRLPLQPTIRMDWRHASLADTEPVLSGLTNTGLPVGSAGFAGWVGDPDVQRQLTYVSMRLDPPVPGLRLRYWIGFRSAGNTGWVDEGTECDARPMKSRIVQIGIDFDGPLAWYYKVVYYIRVIASQTIGPFQEAKIASNGGGQMDPISGLWVSALSKVAASEVIGKLSNSGNLSMFRF